MADQLNPPQRDAVNTLRGPLLVLAGAGTGKTRVVTFRIAALIRHGVRPSRILAVTFTNKAAQEMQQRAGALLGKRPPERPEISTFHSLCVRILRRQITKLGYPQNFTIFDRGDQESLARQVLREIRAPEAALKPGDLLQHIGRWKSSAVRPPQAVDLAATDQEHLAASGYRRYQAALKAQGVVDFDDLLLCTEELFGGHPDACREESARFSHIMVDEYQDTNGSQYRIIKALALPHRNLCVVGDDDQSIYGWRGAEVTHILNFRHDWPDCRVVRLEDNYRSTGPILAMANRLIAFNRKRHDKVLRSSRTGGESPRIVMYPDEEAEARHVVDEIRKALARGDTKPRDVAILFRTNEQPRAFEQELRRWRVPYVLVGGMSFYDRREIKDVLSYMKLLVQPHDEPALLRVINTPARGVGKAAIAALQAKAVERGTSIWEVMQSGDVALTAAATRGLDEFRRLIEQHAAKLAGESPLVVVKALLQAIDYTKVLDDLYDDPQERQSRWNSVEELINALAGYVDRNRQGTLAAFLDDSVLAARDEEPDKQKQLERDAVVLMTLHSAKGLEFPRVWLVGMEEGLLPHHRAVSAEGDAIDEERRLCYVGVTRAQDQLTMTLAQSRRKWGKPRPSTPSRFLFELNGKAQHDAPPPARAKRPVKAGSGPKRPVRGRRPKRAGG